ncbi:MAG: zinc ribbon domain-containing protein [Candidatus Hodarchaeales archaeon]|jgi:ribosomal protein L40E
MKLSFVEAEISTIRMKNYPTKRIKGSYSFSGAEEKFSVRQNIHKAFFLMEVSCMIKICPKCSNENPIAGKYCIYCGEMIPNTSMLDTSKDITCGKCGAVNSKMSQFCLSCGNSLSPFAKKDAKNQLFDYWYCSNDHTLMKETTSNHQFMVSKELEKSLGELEVNGKIKPEQRDLTREIAQKIFKTDPSVNFSVLTRTRCPICMQDSLAPIYFQPPQKQTPVSPFSQVQHGLTAQAPFSRYSQSYFHPERLTIMSMFSNGFDFILSYPKILIIPILIIGIRSVLNLIGVSLYDSSNIVHWTIQGYFFEELTRNSLGFIIGLLADLILESAFITTILVSFVKFKEQEGDFRINKENTLTNSFEFLPRIILAKIVIDGSISLCIVILDLINDYMIGNYPMGQSMSIIVQMLFLATSIFSLILLLLPMILFLYVPQCLIIDNLSVPNGLITSIKFIKRFLGPTLLFFIIIFFIPSGILSILPYEVWEIGIPSVIFRLIDTFQLLCLAWAYDKFKDNVQRFSDAPQRL